MKMFSAPSRVRTKKVDRASNLGVNKTLNQGLKLAFYLVRGVKTIFREGPNENAY